jgi:hypothetical protein
MRKHEEKDEINLLQTTDAMIWAEEFCRIYHNGKHDIEPGWLVGWFANAMLAQEMALKERENV